MKINFLRWKETDEATKKRILRRAETDIEDITKLVRPIIDAVRDEGDAALVRFAKQFEKADLTPATIKASEEEFDQAGKRLDDDLKNAIRHCADNVRRFHEEQMKRIEKRWMVEIEPGVWAGEQVTPIESTGLYVPRGRGAFPSAMYMLCIPAVVAGVENIAVCTPPTPDGGADDASLYTAKLCGVRNVYKAGGAQAIAAFAFGTETIPAVKKVSGPGSAYVAAAKRVLAHRIDPGMPAGPSESIILCDGSADPHNTALDVLNEAEHGDDSAALLVTPDETLARAVCALLPGLIAALPDERRRICESVMGNYGAIVLTDTMDDAIELSNAYAPEHLLVKVRNAKDILPRLRHAGEILIGERSPSTLANYGIGVNHVLPTGGNAHTFSATGVWDFLKISSLAFVNGDVSDLSADIVKLAGYEGFPAHCKAVTDRRRDPANTPLEPKDFIS
ncbi:MAG: histidinol dehydrogenase [Alphaproteobacteria bacterium]|nr:histidinol dehydrogenase [Alphaproteobacteria bacterium]